MGLVNFRKDMRRMVGKSDPVAMGELPLPPLGLPGLLRFPAEPKALICFVNGTAGSCANPRNRTLAQALNQHGFATLLFDLVSEDEDAGESASLAGRLAQALCVAAEDVQLRGLPFGLFAAEGGAAAALMAAARLAPRIGAIVARSGPADLIGTAIEGFKTPSLLIVGGADEKGIAAHEALLSRLTGPKAMEIIAGAGPFFSEPGALTAVTVHAARWFENYLRQSGREMPEAACR